MPWFDQAPWLVALAPFFGLFLSAFAKRTDPFIAGDRVYRHDAPARLSHWTHGIGTAVCLASGIVLGLRFTPAFVEDGPAAILWQNVHFAAAIVFLFGTFYYLGNTIISKWRLREHLPTKNVVAYTVRHYGLLVGIKKFTMPPEDKYFESEKAAYVMAVVTAALLVVTGLVKALAHVVLTLPDGLMNVMFWVHDIAAALMLLFLAAHVFFAVIAPFSWKTFPSMLIGWMPRGEAEKEHAGWMERLEREQSERGMDESALGAGERAAVVERRTRETDIRVRLDLDGSSTSRIDTGLKFFDHMLDQIVHHAGISLDLQVRGDLQVDEHHTIEDTAIALGEAIRRALGSKLGIGRYGFCLPMDECRAAVLLDFGGRIELIWNARFSREYVGDVPTEMFRHFFKSLAESARCNLYVEAEGENEHHKIEAIFKAFARALRTAIARDNFHFELPSSKGTL